MIYLASVRSLGYLKVNLILAFLLLGTHVYANPVLNGDFQIWGRRGESGIYNTPPDLTHLDGEWNISYGGTSNARPGSFFIERVVLNPNVAAQLDGSPKFALHYKHTTASSGYSFFDISHNMENVRSYQGKTVTMSAWMFSTTTKTIYLKTEQYYGSSNGSAGDQVINTSSPITLNGGAWARVAFTTKLATAAGHTFGTDKNDCLNLIFSLPPNQANDIYITSVLLSESSTERFPVTMAMDEYNRNSRYYQKSYDQETAPGTSLAYPGSVNAVMPAYSRPILIQLTNKLRVKPVITLYSVRTGAAGYWWDHQAQADVPVVASDIGQSSFYVYTLNSSSAGHILVGHWVADSSI